jgi:hypothetical protein
MEDTPRLSNNNGDDKFAGVPERIDATLILYIVSR